MVTSGGGRVVGDTGTVVVVGGGDEAVVTFGATVVFPAAVITQSAGQAADGQKQRARQPRHRVLRAGARAKAGTP